MDESASQVEIVNRYGGSDVAAPSHNRMRYTRHGSVHDALNLGPVDRLNTVIDGMVGAESGTQTLFFEVQSQHPSRIGLRLIRSKPYIDQYISTTLSSEGGPLVLGPDGFAGSTIASAGESGATQDVVLDLGYVNCGYFERPADGSTYTEQDCSFFTVPGITTDPVFSTDANFDSPYGAVLPAGPYRFTVSSSQWPQLPYCIQIVVIPVGRLAGVATCQSIPRGRLSLSELASTVQLSSLASARLSQGTKLAGVSDMEARPVGVVTRTSPYGL